MFNYIREIFLNPLATLTQGQILFKGNNLIMPLVEGHLWKAKWKEKPNDEGHRKLTMNS